MVKLWSVWTGWPTCRLLSRSPHSSLPGDVHRRYCMWNPATKLAKAWSSTSCNDTWKSNSQCCSVEQAMGAHLVGPISTSSAPWAEGWTSKDRHPQLCAAVMLPETCSAQGLRVVHRCLSECWELRAKHHRRCAVAQVYLQVPAKLIWQLHQLKQFWRASMRISFGMDFGRGKSKSFGRWEWGAIIGKLQAEMCLAA